MSNENEQIDVFISSAMGTEDSLNWAELRENIANKIKASRIFSPYIIEDHGSFSSSTEQMLKKVIDNDIYILLLRRTLKNGTELELQKAIEFNKPKLIYFLDSKLPVEPKVEEFKKNVINLDLCLFHSIKEDKIKSLPKKVVEDLQNDVVQKFREYISQHHLSKTKKKDLNDFFSSYISEFSEPTVLIPENERFIKTLVFIENDEKKQIVSKKPLISFYETFYDKNKNLFLISEPYLGKSTELKTLYLYCSNIINKDLLRFFDLSFYTGETLKDLLKLSDDKSFKYLIFFDAYDEINSSIKKLFLNRLEELHSTYQYLHFIISSRSNEAQDIITRIHPNDKKAIQYQIVSLVKNNIEDEEDEIFKQKLSKINDQEIREKVIIPYYRTQIDTILQDSSPSSFIKAVIKSNFEKVNKNNKFNEEVLKQIHIDLKNLSIFLFKKKTTLFTVNDFDFEFPGILKFDFFQKNNKNQYSISRKIYEYYVAEYFNECDISLIQKVFFVKDHLRIDTLNIFLILLSISKISNVSLYNALYKLYSSTSPEVFLIGDFNHKSNSQRLEEFKKIFIYRINNKKEIYKSRYYSTETTLSGIEDMQKKMLELLPEEKQKEGFDFLIEQLKDGIKQDNQYKIRNSLSLLLYEHVFNFSDNQKKEFFEIINELLKMKYSTKAKSSGYINVYSLCEWINNSDIISSWLEEDYIAFINNILSKSIDFSNLNTITQQEVYSLLLDFYVTFYNKPLFNKIGPKIIIKLLSENFEDFEDGDSFVPPTISDSYKIKTVKFLDSIFLISNLINQINLSPNDCISILNSTIDLKRLDTNQKNLVENVFNKCLEYINQEDEEFFNKYINLFYKRMSLYGSFSSGKEWTSQLNPLRKEKFINTLSKFDFSFIDSSLCDYMFIIEAFTELLNDREVDSEKVFHYIKNINTNVYERCLSSILSDKSHILNSIIAERIYREQPEFLIDKEQKLLLHEELNIKKDWSNKHDPYILMNKDEVIKQIKDIEEFINLHKSAFSDHDDWVILSELKYDNAQKRIDWTTKDEREIFKNLPLFSNTILSFCSEILRASETNSFESLQKTLNQIYESGCFYRFFYLYYLQPLSKDMNKVHELFENNIQLTIELKTALQNQYKDFLRNISIDMISNLQGNKFLKPFIFYVKTLYSNCIPSWVSKEDFDKLICYPYSLGMTGFSSSSDRNTFTWLLEISSYTEEYIEDKCLEYIPQLKLTQNNSGISSMISFLYTRLEKSNRAEEIKRMIINLSKQCLLLIDDNNYPINLTYTLSSFWYSTKENFIDEIFEFLTTKNFKRNDNFVNYLFDYASRIMTIDQKKAIIDSFSEDSECLSFLAAIGDEKTICKEIDEYINNKDLDSEFEFRRSPFGFIKQSNEIFNKAISLLNYSLEIPTIRAPRREALARIALELLNNHTTKDNYEILEKTFNNLIKILKQEDYITNYYEKWKYDLDEKLFENDIEYLIPD